AGREVGGWGSGRRRGPLQAKSVGRARRGVRRRIDRIRGLLLSRAGRGYRILEAGGGRGGWVGSRGGRRARVRGGGGCWGITVGAGGRRGGERVVAWAMVG